MKKLLTLALAVIFVATAFTAFATDTTFEGQYRVRAWNEYNFDKKLEDVTNLPGHENAQYDGWFDQRFRLTITHTRSEFLKAVIRFDLVEDTWGQQRNLLINNNNANLINLAYIEFTLPQIGTFTVGKFNETYGYGLAFSDEGDGTIGLTGARWANAWGPVAASVLYAKVKDNVIVGGPGSRLYNWDSDLWAGNIKITPMENHVIELFGGVVIDSDADDLGVGNGVMDNSFSYLRQGDGAYSAVVGFWGLAYTGTIADMIDIALEGNWIYGHGTFISSLAFRNEAGPLGDPISLTISGWNIYADVSYFNDLLRVGVAFIMGSGQAHWWNDISTTNINMNYISQDDFAFNNIIVNGGGGTNSIWGGSLYGQDNLENITAVKLYFEICPIEKLTLNASITWAKWTEEVGQNLGGTRAAFVGAKGSAYEHPARIYGNYPYQSWDASDDLGWELDFGFSYEIMEGLTYSLGVGVLFTGDSWDYEKADGTRGDWGEIWSISNQLLYEF